MRARPVISALALPAALLLGGCGYVHLGRLPEPTTTVVGDEKLMQENSDLRAERKILQQELALTRAQGDALRMAIENRAADGDTSKRLTDKLTETSRELAQLRASYAILQGERNQAVATAANAAALQSQLGATEEKLATSLRNFTELQQEINQLKTDVQQARTENLALTEQVRTVTAQNAQAQAALAQLNTELLAQKDARVRAEQDAETLRSQVAAAGANASALEQQRTGAAAEARSLAAEQAKEIVSLKQDLTTLRAKVDTLEAERSELKQKLEAAPPPDLANIEAKLASALRDNTELRAAKSNLEAQLAKVKSAPAEQVQGLRDQLRDAQAAAEALTAENAQLKTRLAAANTRVIPADQVTRLNLDAPAPTRTVERASPPPPAGESNLPLAETAPERSVPVPPTATRGNGSGVTAALMTTVPGSPRTTGRVDVSPSAGAPRTHVVTGGDTLSKISILYYGTPARWADILAANRDILGENNNLVIGRTLRIP